MLLHLKHLPLFLISTEISTDSILMETKFHSCGKLSHMGFLEPLILDFCATCLRLFTLLSSVKLNKMGRKS